MKSHLVTIITFALLLIIGIFIGSLFRSCRKEQPPVVNNYDSLVLANNATKLEVIAVRDSVKAVIARKDSANALLKAKLKDITIKYVTLRNNTPNKDTVVKIHDVYDGKECMEKLPVIQSMLDTCSSEKNDYSNAIDKLGALSAQVQSQYDACMKSGALDKQAIAKLDKKRKWNKRWALVGTITTFSLVVALLVGK